MLASAQADEAGGFEPIEEAGSPTRTSKVYAPTYYPHELSSERAMPISVRAGVEAEANFSLARVPSYKISGKVLGLPPETADKEDVKNFHIVYLMHKGSISPAGRSMIGKDFSFEIAAVPAGEYRLVVVSWDRTTAASFGIREVIVEAADVKGITVAFNSSAGQLTGSIRIDGESKLDFSKLALVFADAETITAPESDGEENSLNGYAGFAQVQKDGSFKSNVTFQANRVYAAVVAREGGFEDWYTSKVLVNGKDTFDSGFNVADAQRGRIEIVISKKSGTIEGTALDSENKPFSNAQVVAVAVDPKLRRRFDMLQKTKADQQGKFRLRGVRPGDYMVMALEDAEEQPFAEDVFLKQNADRIQTIKVEASAQQVQLQTIKIEQQQ